MSRWAQTSDRAQIVRELIVFLWEQKLWWIIPMVIVLLGFGILLILAQSSPIARVYGMPRFGPYTIIRSLILA